MKGTYKVAPHIAWRRVEEEIVALDLNTSVYYSFNDVGARVWELVAGSEPAAKVAEAVAAEFDGDAAAIAKDTEEFIDSLCKEKLLEPAA